AWVALGCVPKLSDGLFTRARTQQSVSQLPTRLSVRWREPHRFAEVGERPINVAQTLLHLSRLKPEHVVRGAQLQRAPVCAPRPLQIARVREQPCPREVRVRVCGRELRGE